MRFRTDELQLRINDRLAAPNDDATFAAVKPELDGFCRELFGAPADITRTGTAKGLFTVKIATGAKSRRGHAARAPGRRPARRPFAGLTTNGFSPVSRGGRSPASR